MVGDVAERCRVEPKPGRRDAVEHLSGLDVADLEAEEVPRRGERERLGCVDRERPDTGVVEGPDLPDDPAGRCARDLEVGGVDAAEVDVLAVGADDRLVWARAALDRACDLPGGWVDDLPGAAVGGFSDGHVDLAAVGGDRDVVDAGLVLASPERDPGDEVVGEHRPGTCGSSGAAVGDEQCGGGGIDGESANRETRKRDLPDVAVVVIDVVDLDAAAGEDILEVPGRRRTRAESCRQQHAGMGGRSQSGFDRAETKYDDGYDERHLERIPMPTAAPKRTDMVGIANLESTR